jgi:hypothetical protein
MTKGIKLFKIFGIQISLDYTWFIIFAIFAWSLAYGYFPYYHPGLEKPVYIAMGVISALQQARARYKRDNALYLRGRGPAHKGAR